MAATPIVVVGTTLLADSPTGVPPACAAEQGSWCQRVWDWTHVHWLSQYAAPLIGPILGIALIVVLAVVVRVLARRMIRRLTTVATDAAPDADPDVAESKLTGEPTIARRGQRARSLGSLLNSAVTFVVVVVAGLLILAQLGINIGPLLASAGIAGIALGFGAQTLVRDLLSGIFMLVEDQYGVGDAVDLGPATGTVVAVGLRVTTLRGSDGRLWYVRNGEISRVGNASQGSIVVTIDLTLPYRVDTERAGEIALKQAETIAEADAFADLMVEPPRLQGLVATTTDTATLRLVATVRPGAQAGYERAVRTAAKSALDAAGLTATT